MNSRVEELSSRKKKELSPFEQKLNDWVAKKSFGPAVRIKFYERLLYMTSAKKSIKDSLIELQRRYSERKKKSVVAIIKDIQIELNRGKNFSGSIKTWIPAEEQMLIMAGEKKSYEVAFPQAIEALELKGRIKKIIVKALLYPLSIIALIAGVVYGFGTELAPILLATYSGPELTGTAGIIQDLPWFVETLFFKILFAIVVLFVVIPSTLGIWNSDKRIVFDRFGPWAIYRVIKGSGFVISVAGLIDSGMNLSKALSLTLEDSSPWLRERVEATIRGLERGLNLGQSLNISGYRFPDQEIIDDLIFLSSERGLESQMKKICHKWIEQAIEGLEKRVGMWGKFGIVAAGGMIIVLVSGIMGISQALSKSVAF